MRNDPSGSIWRRWDLHFHTPASFDYENKSVNAQRLVDGLIAAGVEVVAVTDHHVINVELIREMQRLAAGRLTVLPGIELRSELGGTEHVHYIGIFHEDCDLNDVWIKLQDLGISASDIKTKGNESTYVSFVKGCTRIRELGGIVTVHAGKKSNSIEELANADAFKSAYKTDLAKEHLHSLEVGKQADCDGYRNIVFPHIGKELPLIICSDNHNIDNYTTKCPMWVKADPSFVGLLQLSNVPSGRIYLGDQPTSIAHAKQNATKYMNAVSFARTEAAADIEYWFDGTIPLNHGLIAIIGNKGSGKSALADILAFLGDTQASGHFSFLCRERFLDPKTNLGSMFSAKVSWHSGREVPRVLNESIDQTAPELVKYIPQNYLEAICSELKESRETQFYRELMEVIFSHVTDAERIGKETLPALIDYLTNVKEELIEQVLVDLAATNDAIVQLEDQCTEEYRKSLSAQLYQRRTELEAHSEAKPAEVKEPEQDPEAQETTKAITAELAELQHKADDLDQRLTTEREQLRQAALQIAAADRLLTRIGNLERQIATFYTDSSEDSKVLELDVKDLIVFKANQQPILDAKTNAEERRRIARESLAVDVEGSLATQHSAATASIETRRLQLDEPNRRYHNYLLQLADWNKKHNEILGSAENADSVKGLEAKLATLSSLPSRIADLQKIRIGFVQEIFQAKEQLLADYRKLYASVQEFISQHPISKQHGALQFSASISVERLVEGFLDMIHQGRKGSFQGEQEGRDRLREIVSSSDFSTWAGVQAFLASVQEHLEYDKRDGTDKPVRLRDQLRQNISPQGVYSFLYSLSYLKPRFELRWQGKPLDQLSPGERGNLLLVFYLLIDNRDVPLIIDQPEENLDNQTIATVLVPAIKYAKKRRQIILVTHNPNLAVVCDADQVIHAQNDKTAGNRVVYTSGAIENPTITKLIMDVLEGTKPAFDLRDAVYNVLERSM